MNNAALFVSENSENGLLTFRIGGRLDSATTGRVWVKAMRALSMASPEILVIDASALDYCDGAGVGLLFELRRKQLKSGRKAEIHGLRKEFRQLLDLFDPSEFDAQKTPEDQAITIPEEVGQATYRSWSGVRDLISFTGEVFFKLTHALLNPHTIRWKDVFLFSEIVGVDALPIIALISFLMGLIMAFQAAIPMRQFGADIYVANLVALSILKELGPLMTAIVLAGRSGSAFAAELGTMKVNEEIDALSTMGLDPVGFLVIPRMIAAIVMTPLLTLFADCIGVAGGAVVMFDLGHPLISYYNQVFSAVNYIDLSGGLIKSVVFGLLVAGLGCYRGLNTAIGASAVGDSATRSVVSSIIFIVAADGLFSIIYYYLGI